MKVTTHMIATAPYRPHYFGGRLRFGRKQGQRNAPSRSQGRGDPGGPATKNRIACSPYRSLYFCQLTESLPAFAILC